MKGLRSLDGTQPVTGCVLDGRVHPLSDVGDPASRETAGSPGSPLPEEFPVPVLPGTVFGMAHSTGPSDRELPSGASLKAAASMVGPGEAIPLPDGIGRVDAEAELAAVISTPLRGDRPADAPAALLGRAAASDVTGRDAQRPGPSWTEEGSRSDLTPLGPWIETELDVDAAWIRVWRNGEEVASGSTSESAGNSPGAISCPSTLVESRAGDGALTAVPNTSAEVRPGDVVAAEIAGVGVLGSPP